MKITVARPNQPVFHPVTVVFETREDLAVLVAAIAVAPGRAVATEANRLLYGQADYSDNLHAVHTKQYDRLLSTYYLAVQS